MAILRGFFIVTLRSTSIPLKELWSVFLMGLHYDVRIVCILLLPLLLIGSFRRLNPFESKTSRSIMICFAGIFAFFFCLFYAVDFIHFRYLSERLNAQVLNYLEDGNTSLNMV